MKPSVLICEDVKKTREALRKCLEGEFTVVGEVADGASAVLAARELRPSLVLMDVVMPKLSGLEAAKAILSESQPPRVIFVSGLKDQRVVMEAFQIGAGDYLFKPVDEKVLRQVLHRHTDKPEA